MIDPVVQRTRRRVVVGVLVGTLALGLIGPWQVLGRAAEVSSDTTWAGADWITCDHGRDVALFTGDVDVPAYMFNIRNQSRFPIELSGPDGTRFETKLYGISDAYLEPLEDTVETIVVPPWGSQPTEPSR